MALPKKRPDSWAAGGGETLLDQLMPVFEFGNRHEIIVKAPVLRVAEGVETYRLDRSSLVRLLFRLRGLGAAPRTLRHSLLEGGFTLLAEKPGREVVVGIAGRFWALDERGSMVHLRDAQAFLEFKQAGAAKVTVNLLCEPLDATTTRLSTETRVHCVDASARRRFALYWALIKPFSGCIRRDMLHGMRRHVLERMVS